MAAISRERQLKNGTWAFTVRVFIGKDVEGKSLFLNDTYKSETTSKAKARKEAEAFARDLERDFREGKIGSGKQKFSEYAEYVVALLREREKIKISTELRYKELLVRINQKIGTLPLRDVNAVTLNRLYSWLGSDGMNLRTGGKLSGKTVVEHHRLIHRILEQAVREGLIGTNPADRVEKPESKRGAVGFVPPEMIPEIETALLKEEFHWRVFLEIEIWTGMRPGEINGLKWADIDLIEGKESIHIERGVRYAPGKGVYEETPKTENGVRTIPIPAHLAELLRDYRREQGRRMMERGDYFRNEGWLFLNSKGDGTVMHPQSPGQWFSRFRDRNGFPEEFSLYSFRHGYASSLIAGGADLRETSRLMGHANPGFTMSVYVHPEERRDSVHVLERLYGRSADGKNSGENAG